MKILIVSPNRFNIDYTFNIRVLESVIWEKRHGKQSDMGNIINENLHWRALQWINLTNRCFKLSEKECESEVGISS